MTTATSGVLARFPWLLPVRNSFASYGAAAVARTSNRGHVAEVKNQFHGVAGSQSGFPKKPFSPLMSNRCSVSSMNMLKTIYQRCVVRMRVYAIYFSMRLGDAIDPCHLANGFEAVISYECQERRANPLSRIPRIQTSHANTSHARCDKGSEWVGGKFPCVVETYDGPAWRLISTLCGESATRNLANRSMRIQDVYVGAVPIPQFIKLWRPMMVPRGD